MQEIERENIAATVARVAAKPVTLLEAAPLGGGSVTTLALPPGYTLQTVDDERDQPTPRHMKARATLDTAEAFLAYVALHHGATAAVWCAFDPVAYSLQFTAVLDEHGQDEPRWRHHTAVYKPRLSVEWGTWLGRNGKDQTQIGFAEFIESNEKDIAGIDKMPTSLQMMTMATQFEATAEKRFKSKVRLQSGGVALEYVDTDDNATIEQMRLYERFQIGIPVFWSLRAAGEKVAAWAIEARLKYSVSQGKVSFAYHLQRPDLVHERAALDMIEQIRVGLGGVPLRMGSCA
jgi:uncharacterized protein YfdQ (DUF2303 family)